MSSTTASRRPSTITTRASNTPCPPRRSFVASDARRRGQGCSVKCDRHTAFGAALPTSALRASVDNAQRFKLIVDD
jgi:hypothetical protein